MLIIQQAEAKIILLAQPLFRLAIYRSGVQVAESLMLCPCVSDASLPSVDQAEIPWPAMLTLPAPHSSAGWPWQPSPAPLQKRSQRYKVLHHLSWLQTINSLRKSVLVPGTSDAASACSLLFLSGMTQCLPDLGVHTLPGLASVDVRCSLSVQLHSKQNKQSHHTA